MTIETTVNIDANVLWKISRASMIAGVSKRDVISSLLRKLSCDHRSLVQSWTRVRYQKRAGNNTWKCVHITLWPDEYEFFLDLRKVCKKSVSCLIAYAVEKYLDEVVKGLIKITDNNRYKNYTIIGRIVDGIVCWTYYWGLPRTLPVNP
jgi:hypothetical protein